jgi:cytochrome o ubiquinol oxidase subunit 3
MMEHAITRQGLDDAHGHDAHAGHGAHTNHQSLPILGFWIFLVTDCLLFGTLFAAFVVLRTHVDGGPTGKELFDVPGFTAETFILLTSSFTSGLALLSMHKKRAGGIIAWLVVTVLLGAAFVGLEVNEFTHMAAEGAVFSRSAFLSAFYTLVGTHGLHVSTGLVWMIAIMIQLRRYGVDELNSRKLFIVGLYWHFLDVVWIFIFTFVYLMGVY